MSRRRLVVASTALLFVGAVTGCAEEEQGGLEGASPGPGAVVGGEIDRIQLFYDDIIVAADGSVSGPDGSELASEFVVDSEISAVAELDGPLDQPGDYEVRHVVDAVDGDRVDDSYTFTYDPTAASPQLVFPPEDSGVPWLLWLVALAGAVAIGVAGWRLMRSMAQLRSTQQGTSEGT
jgi:hypothetical protein